MFSFKVVVLAFVAGMLGAWCAQVMFFSNTPEGMSEQLNILSTPEQDALGLPFAEGVRVGDTIYLSGQIGAKPGTMELVPGGIQAETRQTLENIKASLLRYGSSMDRVAKCTVFLADMNDWPSMNEVYVEMFAGHRPARSAFGASGIALNGAVEIECIAAAGS